MPTTATSTQISFNTTVKVNGVNASTFLSNETYGNAYVNAMAASTNISASDITIVDVIDSTDRRLLRTGVIRELVSTGVLVKTEIRVIVEDKGYASTESNVLYEAIKSTIATSVTTGQFGMALVTAASKLNIQVVITVDDSFAPIVDAVVILIERTANPTMTPTVSPDDDDDKTGFSLFGLEEDFSIVIVAAIGFGGLLFFSILFYIGLNQYNTVAAVATNSVAINPTEKGPVEGDNAIVIKQNDIVKGVDLNETAL